MKKAFGWGVATAAFALILGASAFDVATAQEAKKAKNVILFIGDGMGFNSDILGTYWRYGEADAIVTSGNTGSVLVGGQTIVRREKGVLRAPIATVIPTEKGVALLADSGANVDCRPEHLIQFAVMGQAYSEKVLKVASPKVALLNIGAEEEKGNELTKEVYQLLKQRKDLNFIGNIEASEISKGKADVIVCDAFAGNMVLKMYEGVATTFLKIMKELVYLQIIDAVNLTSHLTP